MRGEPVLSSVLNPIVIGSLNLVYTLFGLQ